METIHLNREKLMDMIKLSFQQGHGIWITINGSSMEPFLQHGRDRAYITELSIGDIKKGEIVLFQRDSHELVLHRVHRILQKDIYVLGDAQKWIEGPINVEHIIGVVKKIERNGKVFDVNNQLYRYLVMLWSWLIPIRYKILWRLKNIYGGK